MVCAHFVAKMIYKKELIEELFMLQKPKPADDNSNTSLKVTRINNGHDTTLEPGIAVNNDESSIQFKPQSEHQLLQDENSLTKKKDEFKEIYRDVRQAMDK